jgi:integrase
MGHEEQTIPRQLASGKWQARGRTPTGKRQSLGTYRTKTLATEVERKYEAQFPRGNWAENVTKYQALEEARTTTFKDLATRYIEIKPLKINTKDEYERYLNRDLQGFHSLLVRQITQRKIEDEQRKWGDRAPKLKQNAFQFLNAVLNYAIELGYIDLNPARHLKLFRRLPSEDKPLPTQEQVREMIALAQSPNQRLALIIAFHAGLRKHEIAELRRKDLTWSKERNCFILTCDRGVTWRAGSEVVIGSRKNNETLNLSMSSELSEEISRLLNKMGTIDPEALIYPLEGTLYIHHSKSGLSRRWRKIANQVGYTHGIHQARKFVVSWAYAVGYTQRENMNRVGQKSLRANELYQKDLRREDELASRLPKLI